MADLDVDDRVPPTFQLTVPDSWFEIDLHPDTRDAVIVSLVDERIRDHRDLREARSGITSALRDHARQASESGGLYCACFVQASSEGPVTGSITVSIIDQPPPAYGTEPDAPYDATTQGEGAYRTVGIAMIEGVGQVARTYGVEDRPHPDSAGFVRSVVMQTYVPLPGTPRMMLVSASSPVLGLEEELLDLFDAVSSTFRLTTSN